MTKIVMISSGQPALNPRLVKEADALVGAGYDVTVIYAYWNKWGDELNKKLFPQKKWRVVIAGGHPIESRFTYFISRLLFKTARSFFFDLQLNFFADAAVSRSSLFLKMEAKKHRADLYIGHNIGALSATVTAAKKNGVKCGFDAEDFHRQEVTDDTSSFSYRTYKYTEDKYFRKLAYLTTASPLISEAYSKIYAMLEPVTILNVFPTQHLEKNTNSALGPIKLFWFSQTIGADRGLEDIASSLKSLAPHSYELHLLGYIADDDKQNFITNVLANTVNVHFHAPISSDQIINFASQFDIGLAIENKTPLNRDICLTNKLFTYMQAGLAIIASDTTAQKAIILHEPGVGALYQKEDLSTLTNILSFWEHDRQLLQTAKEISLKVGTEKFNWEYESKKFLSLVNTTLTAVE